MKLQTYNILQQSESPFWEE